MTTRLMPYVTFNGVCEEAMTFYAAALDGKLTLMRFGDSPMPVPEAAKGKIIHSSLHFGEGILFASDSMPGGKAPTMGGNVALSVAADSFEAGTKFFEALAVGGTVTMPFAKQFWGDTFGMLIDKYGNSWMVNAS